MNDSRREGESRERMKEGMERGTARAHTGVHDVVVAQVQDLDVVVELEQVPELGGVLQAVQLVISQVQLPQIHVHLQRGGWGGEQGG